MQTATAPTIPKIPTIRLAAVKSSQIAAIGHDPGTNTLRVQFNGAGSTYDYANVPAAVHGEMLKAESIGKFFGAKVKGVYDFTKLPKAGK